MRLAQGLERMEAAAETVVDADDPPHRARRCVDSRDDALLWPRRLADRTRGGHPSRPPALFSLRGNEI
jgi:hypothetical protein